MDQLCKQLSKFHISTKAIFAGPLNSLRRQLLHELPFAKDLNWGLPDARGRKNAARRRRQTMYRKELLSEMPFACNVSWSEQDPDSIRKAASRARRVDVAKRVASMPQHIHAQSLLKELPLACDPLPNSASEKRPYWEPSVLDYTWYEQLLHGDKEITARDGKVEIGWRTEVMDYTIEARLLTPYRRFALDARKSAGGCGDWQEQHFWDNLSQALAQDLHEFGDERDEILRRHGKSKDDWGDMFQRIIETTQEKHPLFEVGGWSWP